MPTTSPMKKDEKREGGQRYSSPTRFVEDDDLTPPPRQPRAVIALRLRADSDGSTNNAFFREGHPPLPTASTIAKQHAKATQNKKPQRRNKKKKRNDPNAPPPISVVDIEEGEMVSLKRQPQGNHNKAQKLEQFQQQQQLSNRDGGLSSNGVVAPPAAISNRLETIRDVSTEFSSTDDAQARHSSLLSGSNALDESLRLSEGSGLLYGSGLLDNSTRLSVLLKDDEALGSSEFRASNKSNKRRASKTMKATDRTQSESSRLLFTLSDDEDEDDDAEDKEVSNREHFQEEYHYEKKKQYKFDFDSNLWEKAKEWLNPSPWLIRDVKFTETGTPYFEDADGWTASGFFRHYLWNPIAPEFTSLQQFWWAVIIGVAMGVYTALWKMLIETGVDFVWEAIPEVLLELGIFTSLEGAFPLYHYMWLCPMVFGGSLSYVFCILPVPIPGQNEWIKNLHTRGVQDFRTFWPLFVLATLGMLSGLSLGPELPLVLTAGMFGSWLGLLTKQSMLQARVLNLTSASAAVGGFFGFPMAGALFVLEIPHRMGLQYFEALSPATISSIIAVVTNRIITGNDVTGYFKYPFLSTSLPSQIFTHAIFYGLYGAAIGIVYAFSVIKLKGSVHDWFHAPHDHDDESEELHIDDDGSMDYHQHSPERKPLVDKKPLPKRMSTMTSFSSMDSWTPRSLLKRAKKWCTCVIPYEPHRAAVAGAIAGALCGLVSMFVPHTLFWGEAQLQNLIDKGRTPLPVFGQDDEPTADLTALGFCLIDPNDPEEIKAGFSMQCSILLMLSKTVHIGLSLGTGIIGGHFWGPLFIGCAASHFLADLMNISQSVLGFGGSLASYPCLIILCVMGSAHVVTFRAHTAIMLILTLTISSFTADDNILSNIAGDYSAVFPLLVISCFVSLMVSRQSVVFYKEQRSRGDITAVPEVLCEPGMQGRPLVSTYDPMDDDFDDFDDDMGDFGNGQTDHSNLPENVVMPTSSSEMANSNYRAVNTDVTQDDIEKAFEQEQSRGLYESMGSSNVGQTTAPPRKLSKDSNPTIAATNGGAFSRLDELLSAPIDAASPRGSPASFGSNKKSHRRTQSAPVVDPRISLSQRMERRDSATRFDSPTPEASPRERANSRGSLVRRVEAFGELHDHQPPLLEQARLRAASRELTDEIKHRRSPSLPGPSPPNPSNLMAQNGGRRSRQNSASGKTGEPVDFMLALSLEEIEDSFNASVNASLQPKST